MKDLDYYMSLPYGIKVDIPEPQRKNYFIDAAVFVRDLAAVGV